VAAADWPSFRSIGRPPSRCAENKNAVIICFFSSLLAGRLRRDDTAHRVRLRPGDFVTVTRRDVASGVAAVIDVIPPTD